MDIDKLIAQAKAQFNDIAPVEQEVLLGEEVITVRLSPMWGTEWRDLTSKHPARTGAAKDTALGYNLESVLADYPKVAFVDGDDAVDVSEKWTSICDVLSAPDMENLAIALWGLNEFDPGERLTTAKEAKKKPAKAKR